MTLTKGALTRLQIIEQARAIFNEEGIDITLDVLTQKMGLTKSRINNHFRTKDSLFLAILHAYETDMSNLLKQINSLVPSTPLQQYVDTLAAIMDLQYHYRCGTHYLNLATSAQNELTEHTLSTGERNTLAILARIKKMVDDKWLNPAILEEPNWSAFRFTYINSLTQWSVFYNMYDRNKPYKKVKSNYLRAVITHSYAPYLTKKGEKAFAELVFNR